MEDNHNNEIKYDETGDFVCYLLTLDRGEHAEFIKLHLTFEKGPG